VDTDKNQNIGVKMGLFKLKYEGEEENLIYASPYSSAFDLISQIDITLAPGKWDKVPTGLFIIDHEPLFHLQTSQTHLFPQGHLPVYGEIQVRPRSGLAYKYGITVLNSPSTIDADYRGEIQVILINHGSEDFVIEKGFRIAQAVCCLVVPHAPYRDHHNPLTERGTKGFGSSGI